MKKNILVRSFNGKFLYTTLAALLFFLIAWYFGHNFLFKFKPAVSIESDISLENKKMINDFLHISLKEEYLPEALRIETVPSATAEANGLSEYFASWENKDQVFNLLYVIRKGQVKPDFVRVWLLDTYSDLDEKKATETLANYFNKEFVDLFEVGCEKVSVDKNSDLIDCGQMKYKKPNDFVGVSVKGPLPISDIFVGQSIMACLIPDGLNRGYNLRTCI